VVKVKRVGDEFLINGRRRADRIVSMLPLREAPRVFGLPEEAFKVAQRLDYNSVVVVGVGLRRDTP
jgi:protoporphyrinogen oxidase